MLALRCSPRDATAAELGRFANRDGTFPGPRAGRLIAPLAPDERSAARRASAASVASESNRGDDAVNSHPRRKGRYFPPLQPGAPVRAR